MHCLYIKAFRFNVNANRFSFSFSILIPIHINLSFQLHVPTRLPFTAWQREWIAHSAPAPPPSSPRLACAKDIGIYLGCLMVYQNGYWDLSMPSTPKRKTHVDLLKLRNNALTCDNAPCAGSMRVHVTPYHHRARVNSCIRARDPFYPVPT